MSFGFIKSFVFDKYVMLWGIRVCISDETLYAVVDPFEDFECIGFHKE